MTEKMPSSANVGSRPSSFLIRSNSSEVRLCAAMTSGVISLISFLDQFIDRGSQLIWVYAAEMFVDHFTFCIEKKSCRETAGPTWVDQIDRRFGIRNVEQVGGHVGFHRSEELRHRRLDVAEIVERDGDKVHRLRAIFGVDLYQVGKLVATGIAPRGPKVNEQRTFALFTQDVFEGRGIDRRDDYGLLRLRRRFGGAALLFLGRR